MVYKAGDEVSVEGVESDDGRAERQVQADFGPGSVALRRRAQGTEVR